MSANNADGMANSVDPDQTAPLGAVWSGSVLFAQAYLSENIGSLRYIKFLGKYDFLYENKGIVEIIGWFSFKENVEKNSGLLVSFSW